MTLEEQEIFFDKIKESILPFTLSIPDDQIKELIMKIEEENQDIPKGFGNMLYEQILINKYNKRIL